MRNFSLLWMSRKQGTELFSPAEKGENVKETQWHLSRATVTNEAFAWLGIIKWWNGYVVEETGVLWVQKVYFLCPEELQKESFTHTQNITFKENTGQIGSSYSSKSQWEEVKQKQPLNWKNEQVWLQQMAQCKHFPPTPTGRFSQPPSEGRNLGHQGSSQKGRRGWLSDRWHWGAWN